MIEILAAILFVLRQVGQYLTSIKGFSAGGNLDPLFLLGFIYLIANYKNEALRKKWLLFIGVFIIYAGIQWMINPTLDITKMIINIIKIVLCVMTMFYIKDKFTSFNYPKFSVIASSLLGLLTLSALIFPQSIFWMLNDVYNKYDPIRLRLLYIEPSELGFHLLILSIFQLGYILISTNRKTKIILGICLFINAFIMFWTRSLGAIGIGAISIFVMILMDWIRHRSRQKDMIYSLIILAGVMTLIVMIILKVSIVMRLYESISGSDPSTFYRVTISFTVSLRALLDSYGIGFGFGNMNTAQFALLYGKYGFAKVLANAYLYFLVEGGYFAFVFLYKLISSLIKRCLSSTSIIKWGLLSFLLIYQIVGSYFTNPIIWCIYGILLSDFNENKEKAFRFETLSLWIK